MERNGSADVTPHPLQTLARRYPQLLLPVCHGMRETEEYRNAVLRGIPVEAELSFSMNIGDRLETVATPAGEAEVLFLAERDDFEHAIRSLAYRCEPAELPASMGASAISGLINWEKLHSHMEEYLRNGGTDEDGEFARFTSDKSNYLDSLIVLSSGPYSAVSATDMGMEPEQWNAASVTIRKYHELAHFFSRRLYPENKEAVRDEILADLTGLLAAFGTYDAGAARRFLGIEGESYREGGRLQNYVENEDGASAMGKADRIISELTLLINKIEKRDVFEVLGWIEENRIAL